MAEQQVLEVKVSVPGDPDPKAFVFLSTMLVGDAAQRVAEECGISVESPTFQDEEGRVLDRGQTLRAAGVENGDHLFLVSVGGGVYSAAVPTGVTIASIEAELPAIRACALAFGWSVLWDLDALRLIFDGAHERSGCAVRLIAEVREYPARPPSWFFAEPGGTEVSGRFPKSAAVLPGVCSIFHGKRVICAPFNRLAYQDRGGPPRRLAARRVARRPRVCERPDARQHARGDHRAPPRQRGVQLMVRTKPLPTAPPRSRLLVPRAVADTTVSALQSFCGKDGRHEGLVLWAGRRVGDVAIALAAVVPESDHGPQHVLLDERACGRAIRAAHALGLGLVAQVHSHPGSDTRHSDGDDSLIVMPSEGYFSIVVARYGDGGFGESVGVHQFHDRRWVRIERPLETALSILPSLTSVPHAYPGRVLPTARLEVRTGEPAR